MTGLADVMLHGKVQAFPERKLEREAHRHHSVQHSREGLSQVGKKEKEKI